MKSLTIILFLVITSVALAEDPAELAERRQAWETQRTEAQQKIDKRYFEELEGLKQNFTKADNIAAALVVDNAIKGCKEAENEPAALAKTRVARNKSLEKALKPLDKQYWQSLKTLRKGFQKQGNLAGVVATDAEIEKVLAVYKKPEAPKEVKEEAKEENPLNGTWSVVLNPGHHTRTYQIKGDKIKVTESSYPGTGDKAKLKKHKEGYIVTFTSFPVTEYFFLDGKTLHIHHWMANRHHEATPHTHTATGTKVEDDKEQ